MAEDDEVRRVYREGAPPHAPAQDDVLAGAPDELLERVKRFSRSYYTAEESVRHLRAYNAVCEVLRDLESNRDGDHGRKCDCRECYITTFVLTACTAAIQRVREGA